MLLVFSTLENWETHDSYNRRATKRNALYKKSLLFILLLPWHRVVPRGTAWPTSSQSLYRKPDAFRNSMNFNGLFCITGACREMPTRWRHQWWHNILINCDETFYSFLNCCIHNFHSCIRISLISFLAECILLEIVNNTSIPWLGKLSLNWFNNLRLIKLRTTANLMCFFGILNAILEFVVLLFTKYTLKCSVIIGRCLVNLGILDLSVRRE